MAPSVLQKYTAFKKLHEDTFVIPNPWNAGTARMLSALGFEALATTSAGYAFSVGKKDSFEALSLSEVLENAREIVAATDLPVSADLENGFGQSPKECAETIIKASRVGLVGGSIEDATGDPLMPIYGYELTVERIQAACEAAKELPFLVTARAENFLYGNPDLKDTIRRLQSFEEAGADVLYAPGLPNLDAIRSVCGSVSKPVNVVMGLSGPNYSVEQLRDAGVKRISVGGSFARAALGGFMRAATEVLEHGTFDYAASAMPDAVASGYMADEQNSK